MTTLIDVTAKSGRILTINADKLRSFVQEGDHTALYFIGEDDALYCTESTDQIKRAIWDMESEFNDIGTHLDSIGSTLHYIHQHMIGEEL